MKSYRISIPLTEHQKGVVKVLAKQEKRSMAQIVAIIFEDGFNLVEHRDNADGDIGFGILSKPVDCKHNWGEYMGGGVFKCTICGVIQRFGP